MEAAEFREWLRIYRKSFPDSEKLRDVRWAATGGWMCAAETRDVFPAWSRPDFGDWPEKKSADQLYYWRTRRRDAEPEQPER